MASAISGFVVGAAIAGAAAVSIGDLGNELVAGIALGVGATAAALTLLLAPEASASKSSKKQDKSNKKQDNKGAGGGKKDKKKQEPKKQEPKKQEPKKQEPKKQEPKSDAPKKQEQKPKEQKKPAASESETESGVPSGAAAEGKKKKKNKNKNKEDAAPVAAPAPSPKKDDKKKKEGKAPAQANLNTTVDAGGDDDSWVNIPSAEERRKADAAAKAARPKKGEEKDPKTDAIPEGHIRSSVSIPSDKHGAIIGKGGDILKLLQEGTGCKVTIPRKEANSDEIIITGPQEGVDKAKSAIKSLIQKGFSSVTNPGWVCQEITVPRKGAVIGKGGEFVKEIQKQCKVQINTSGKEDKIAITGPKAAVLVARSHMEQLSTMGFCSITHPGWVSEEVDFPRAYHKYLIGLKGQTIKSIQGDTKCKINIPEGNDPKETIAIVGPADAVAKARAQVLKVLKSVEEPKEARQQEAYDWAGGDDDEGEAGGDWSSLNAASDWAVDI